MSKSFLDNKKVLLKQSLDLILSAWKLIPNIIGNVMRFNVDTIEPSKMSFTGSVFDGDDIKNIYPFK